jgi:hypothetical protein
VSNDTLRSICLLSIGVAIGGLLIAIWGNEIGLRVAASGAVTFLGFSIARLLSK